MNQRLLSPVASRTKSNECEYSRGPFEPVSWNQSFPSWVPPGFLNGYRSKITNYICEFFFFKGLLPCFKISVKRVCGKSLASTGQCREEVTEPSQPAVTVKVLPWSFLEGFPFITCMFAHLLFTRNILGVPKSIKILNEWKLSDWKIQLVVSEALKNYLSFWVVKLIHVFSRKQGAIKKGK